MAKREINDPVNGGVGETDDQEFGQLAHDFAMIIKMTKAAAPIDEAVNDVILMFFRHDSNYSIKLAVELGFDDLVLNERSAN